MEKCVFSHPIEVCLAGWLNLEENGNEEGVQKLNSLHPYLSVYISPQLLQHFSITLSK
jgi:hypothetical protein